MDEIMTIPAESALRPGLPIFQPEVQDAGRNAVFGALVKSDGDITGLVAYSIFKQNELDWLSDFRTAKGREPTEDEAEAYILGESTVRRLATYRHLADATLAGNGPDVVNGGAGSARAITPRQTGGVGAAGKLSPSTIATVAIGVVILIVIYIVARTAIPK